MEGLVRNPTYNFSRRFNNGYEPLDQHNTQKGFTNSNDTNKEYQAGWRNLSKRRKEGQSMMKSFSYRRQRAKHRQIFLNSFKLASTEDLGKKPKSRKLKTVVRKVKTVVVSVVAFLRIGSLRSCNSRSAIAAAASSPVALVRKCF